MKHSHKDQLTAVAFGQSESSGQFNCVIVRTNDT